MNTSPSGKYRRPNKGLGGESCKYLSSRPMGLLGGDDKAVSSVSVLSFVFRGGLNDSCLMSSSTCKLLSSSSARFLRPLFLSGEQSIMSTCERAPLPLLECQYTLRGSVDLVLEDFTLTSLSEPSGQIDFHPLNDGIRRWILDGEVVVDE
jgi:hypothetical protein